MFREPPLSSDAIVLIREGEPGRIIRDEFKASDFSLAFAAAGKPETGELVITRIVPCVQPNFSHSDQRIWRTPY